MVAPFQSSKFLIAQGPANWYDPLSEAVAKRNQQEEKSLAEWETHRAEKVKVKAEESPIKVLEAVANLSVTAGKLAQQFKQADAKKKSADSEYVKNLVDRYGTEVGNALAAAYVKDKDLIFSEENATYKDLKAQFPEEKYKSFFSELEDLGGRRQVRLKEEVAARESIRLGGEDSYINSEEFGSLSADEKKAYNNDSEEGRLQTKKDWIHRRIAKMGLSDELIMKFMAPEVSRANATRRGISTAKTSYGHSQKTKALYESFFKTKALTLDSNDVLEEFKHQVIQGAEGLTTLKDGTTPLQQSAKIVLERFNELNRNGFIPQISLTDLKNYTFDHPAGPGGKLNLLDGFFKGDEEVFNSIIEDNRIGQRKYLAVQASLDNDYANQLMEIGHTGQMTKDQFDLAILGLEGRGNLSAQTITALKKIDPTKQDDATYQLEKDSHWTQAEINGDIDSKDNVELAKSIQNDTLQVEVQSTQNRLKLSKNKNKFKSHDQRLKANANLVMKISKQRTLGDNEVLEGFNERLSIEINQLESQLYMDIWKRDPEATNISEQVAIEKKRILTERGFYAQVGEPEEGIWSRDSKGNFPNYEAAVTARNLGIANWDLNDANSISTAQSINNWQGIINNARKQAKHNVSSGEESNAVPLRIANTPGLLEPDDLTASWIGIKENNKSLNIKNFKPTPKLSYIASTIPNVSAAQLWKIQTKLLIQSKDPNHQAVVKAFGLEEKLNNVPNHYETLAQAAERTGDKYLSAVINHGDPHNFTANQLQRLITSRMPVLPDNYKEQEDEINKIVAEQRSRIRTKKEKNSLIKQGIQFPEQLDDDLNQDKA